MPGKGGIDVVGVGAMARVFEHVNLLFAWVGWTMRLPVMRSLLQLVLEATLEKPIESCKVKVEGRDPGPTREG